MTVTDVELRLKKAYPDSEVMVTDLTGTSDHYEVRIATAAFRNLNRMEQQRAVMSVFSDELKTGEMHALTIKTLTK